VTSPCFVCFCSGVTPCCVCCVALVAGTCWLVLACRFPSQMEHTTALQASHVLCTMYSNVWMCSLFNCCPCCCASPVLHALQNLVHVDTWVTCLTQPRHSFILSFYQNHSDAVLILWFDGRGSGFSWACVPELLHVPKLVPFFFQTHTLQLSVNKRPQHHFF
jgi:hypothetical protein